MVSLRKTVNLTKFQSTLPSRERLFQINTQRFLYVISIHAPKPGATSHRVRSHVPVVISIHAPKPGATPRPGAAFSVIPISIHAPKPGATLSRGEVFKIHNNFNPRSQAGSDFMGYFNCTYKEKFQSTLPSRERQLFPSI